MITLKNEPQNVVIAAVLGEFNLADFKEFEEHAQYVLKFKGKAKLLLDLRDMLGFTLDVAWQEIRFTRQHPTDFDKIAVVTDDQWLTWSAWLSRIFTEANVQVFDDYDAALAWISA
jgi:hypothetical protein